MDHFPVTPEHASGPWAWIGAIVIAALVVATAVYLYRFGTRRPKAR